MLNRRIHTWVSIIILISCTKNVYGQNHFNFLYDPDSLALLNYVHDMELYHDHIYLSSKQFCYVSDNKYKECFVVSKFTQNGQFIKNITFDTLFANYRSNNIAVYGEYVYVTGTSQTTTLIGRKTPLIVLDTSLQLIAKYEFEGDSDKVLTNTGIFVNDDLVILHGLMVNYDDKPFEALIHFIDRKTMKVIHKKSYTHGTYLVEISSFDATPDGNFAFMMQKSSKPGAGNGGSYSLIYKINLMGDTVQTFKATDYGAKLRKMVVSSDGSYYFPDAFEEEYPGNGQINKVDANMQGRLWKYAYPNDAIVNNRINYTTQEYYETKNGDILGVGSVFDFADGEENFSHNGFVARFTPEGEMKWLRLYRYPKFFQKDTSSGRFEYSYFKKVVETEDNSIIIAGDVNHGTEIENATHNANIWLLKVNENGCLDGFPCQEIIRLDSASQLDPPYFDIGSTWFYDYFIDVKNVHIKQNSYVQFTIVDTIRKDGELCYVIANNRNLPMEYMKQDGPRIYFWDEYVNDWQLTYHFYGNLNYPTKIEQGVESMVKIDAIERLFFGSYGSQNLQKVRLTTRNNNEIKRDVLKKCGFTKGGLRFVHQLNPSDSIGKIRCYSKGSFFYDFQLYPKRPCDSVWTEVINSNKYFEKSKVVVYPIPFNDNFYIDKKEIKDATNFEIFNFIGQKIFTGNLEENITCIDTNDWLSGTYILSIGFKNGQRWNQLILKH